GPAQDYAGPIFAESVEMLRRRNERSQRTAALNFSFGPIYPPKSGPSTHKNAIAGPAVYSRQHGFFL
ncbi:MAG: hypothetical protein WBC93_17920, partial [Sulfitobacter sp.]